ncbi:MAG: Gmad2 immunoglobulin-like domain-containing protein [Oscillochloridaceae bacterium umkhey_bin13]
MRRLLIVALLLLGGLAFLPVSASHAQSDARCFPETGFCISGPIRQYWERNGGLAVFGFPISPLQTETVENWTGPVQWFERDRLEDHSRDRQGVLAGRLGVEYLALQGRPWQFRPLGQSVPGCRSFPETGYYLCGGFLTYWERNGGLERFGFPVTDQMVERIEGRELTVQYFERRRMEFHPQNRPPFDILLGLLGREVRQGAGPGLQPTPTPQPISQQILIDEPRDNVVVSSPVRISGRTTRMPGNGQLRVRIFEPNGTVLAITDFQVGAVQGGGGSFSVQVPFTAPIGERMLIELSELDRATGAVIARSERAVRYAPTAAQQIFIDTPRQGQAIGTRLTVAGRTLIFPSEGDLTLNVIDSNGRVVSSFLFGVAGDPSRGGTFFVEYEIPNLGGRLVTVEVLDVNARGQVLARSAVGVFAGTPGAYPVP